MVEISCNFGKEKAQEHDGRYCPYSESGRCTKDFIEVTIEIPGPYPTHPGGVASEPFCQTGLFAEEKLAGQAVIRMPLLQRLRGLRR